MQHPGFFERAGPFTLDNIATATGATLGTLLDGNRCIEDVRPLGSAGPSHVTFFENRRYLRSLGDTCAGACFIAASDADRLPTATAVLRSDAPYRAFAQAMTLFYADGLRSKTALFASDKSGVLVHPSAKIADGAVIEPGAIIGREAVIGSGTIVAAGAVIGYRVVIGTNTCIGANCTITHSIIGDGVIIHPGVRIGQDGFGFALGVPGHVKIPQIGRVVIENDVEIGANSTIDRGTLEDTRIGTGTKIDNLVQIGHNVVIGRHCVIVAQSGIAGSSVLGDYVVMGAHSGVLGHVNVGNGVQIAGMAHVKNDVAAGERMGGTPAVPFNDWAREIAAVRQLGKRKSSNRKT